MTQLTSAHSLQQARSTTSHRARAWPRAENAASLWKVTSEVALCRVRGLDGGLDEAAITCLVSSLGLSGQLSPHQLHVVAVHGELGPHQEGSIEVGEASDFQQGGDTPYGIYLLLGGQDFCAERRMKVQDP